MYFNSCDNYPDTEGYGQNDEVDISCNMGDDMGNKVL